MNSLILILALFTSSRALAENAQVNTPPKRAMEKVFCSGDFVCAVAEADGRAYCRQSDRRGGATLWASTHHLVDNMTLGNGFQNWKDVWLLADGGLRQMIGSGDPGLPADQIYDVGSYGYAVFNNGKLVRLKSDISNCGLRHSCAAAYFDPKKQDIQIWMNQNARPLGDPDFLTAKKLAVSLTNICALLPDGRVKCENLDTAQKFEAPAALAITDIQAGGDKVIFYNQHSAYELDASTTALTLLVKKETGISKIVLNKSGDIAVFKNNGSVYVPVDGTLIKVIAESLRDISAGNSENRMCGVTVGGTVVSIFTDRDYALRALNFDGQARQ